jgi:hypothetical protein
MQQAAAPDLAGPTRRSADLLSIDGRIQLRLKVPSWAHGAARQPAPTVGFPFSL